MKNYLKMPLVFMKSLCVSKSDSIVLVYNGMVGKVLS